MFKSSLILYMIGLSASLIFNNCYTMVERIKLVSDADANPNQSREFIGEWFFHDSSIPIFSLRNTRKLVLLPNRNFYFDPNFFKQPNHFFLDSYQVIADTMIFNDNRRTDLTKYLYLVNQDTLMLQSVCGVEIQFWTKQKKVPPTRIYY